MQPSLPASWCFTSAGRLQAGFASNLSSKDSTSLHRPKCSPMVSGLCRREVADRVSWTLARHGQGSWKRRSQQGACLSKRPPGATSNNFATLTPVKLLLRFLLMANMCCSAAACGKFDLLVEPFRVTKRKLHRNHSTSPARLSQASTQLATAPICPNAAGSSCRQAAHAKSEEKHLPHWLAQLLRRWCLACCGHAQTGSFDTL